MRKAAEIHRVMLSEGNTEGAGPIGEIYRSSSYNTFFFGKLRLRIEPQTVLHYRFDNIWGLISGVAFDGAFLGDSTSSMDVTSELDDSSTPTVILNGSTYPDLYLGCDVPFEVVLMDVESGVTGITDWQYYYSSTISGGEWQEFTDQIFKDTTLNGVTTGKIAFKAPVNWVKTHYMNQSGRVPLSGLTYPDALYFLDIRQSGVSSQGPTVNIVREAFRSKVLYLETTSGETLGGKFYIDHLRESADTQSWMPFSQVLVAGGIYDGADFLNPSDESVEMFLMVGF